jgi:hypothetical protein
MAVQQGGIFGRDFSSVLRAFPSTERFWRSTERVGAIALSLAIRFCLAA